MNKNLENAAFIKEQIRQSIEGFLGKSASFLGLRTLENTIEVQLYALANQGIIDRRLPVVKAKLDKTSRTVTINFYDSITGEQLNFWESLLK